MDNEVVIHVVADDNTDRGFASARQKSRKLGEDIDTEMKRVGPKAGDSLGGGMLTGLRAGLPSFAQFGGVIGAIMAPTLGAFVAAGVMGGAGGAGIIGGLVLASKDPAVAAAGEGLKETIGADLKEAASSFVPVALTSIGKVQSAFKGVLPDIREIFTKSSTFVDPLLDGIISGTRRIIGSVRNLVDGARPVFDAFGRAFANIGESVGKVFDSLADNGAEGASAVDDVTLSITKFIEVSGAAINGLTEFKGQLDRLDGSLDRTRYAFEDYVHHGLDLTADGYKAGSEAAELYRQGLIGASDSANNYTHYLADQKKAQDSVTSATNGSASALKKLADEITSQTDPLFAMIDATKQVREAQDKYNEALRRHGPRSREAADALTDLGQAAFRLNSKAGGAAGAFDGKLTPAMRTSLRNAGLTTSQIHKLENQLKSAAKAADNWEGSYTQTYTTYYRSNGSVVPKNQIPYGTGRAHGGIVGQAASGGVRSNMTMVGEHGPELLNLPPGTQVHSNPDTRRMMSGQGGQEIRITADLSKLSGIQDALMRVLRLEVRDGGGSVQQVLGVVGKA